MVDVPQAPRPVRKLLVANRGEIARRIFRTCRELGIATVAVYSDPDRRAPHVADADEAVALGGETSPDTYLSIGKVIDAARRTGADAIHPGYGFLAENAELAEAVLAAGCTWVGPAPASIRAMGDKLAAKELVAAAGVPALPSAALPGDDPEEWAKAAGAVGYPLLVKAAAGGGGKGMTRVGVPGELATAVEAARRLALSAFGDPTVFAERLLERPRHVEVQVLGDAAGNVVHVHTRDCSVQRRHQKVIEEAPAPELPGDLRRRLHEAAVAAARAVGYVGAGTVEFLVAGGECFFLEMNTRLQVEHPVTELVCGIDLVAAQLRIASGGGVAQVPEPAGHAIEARLYAEDPARDFLPSSGRIERFWLPELPGVRIDSGVETGTHVPAFYDPLLAKVIAVGADRDEARRRLVNALRRLEIHGVATNRDMLVAVLDHPGFGSGGATTAFFVEHPETLTAGPPPGVVRWHAVAATLALRARRAAASSLPRVARAGWRNVGSTPARQELDAVVAGGAQRITVDYGPPPRAGYRMPVEVDGESLTVDGVDVSPEHVDVEIGGLRKRAGVHSVGDRSWVNDGHWQTELVTVPRFTGAHAGAAAHGPAAPVPGTVVAVDVSAGDAVVAGQTLVVMEAMKMEHRLTADTDGTISEVRVAAGDKVDAHQVLVVIEPGQGSS